MSFERRLTVLACAALAVVGCSEFFIVDEAGLTGGDGGSSSGLDAAAFPDGSSSSSSGAGSSGTNDASIDGAPTAFCAAGPASIFCDDFDDAVPGQKWDAKPEHGSFLTTTFASPPRSFELPFPDQGSDGVDLFSKQLTFGAAANLRLEVAIRLVEDADVYPVGLFFSGNHRLILNLDGFVNETIGTTQNAGHPYTKAPIDGKWHRYTFTLERATNTVELLIDGTVALAKTTLTNANLLGDGSVKLTVGLYYAPPNTPWTGGFDDVRLTTF